MTYNDAILDQLWIEYQNTPRSFAARQNYAAVYDWADNSGYAGADVSADFVAFVVSREQREARELSKAAGAAAVADLKRKAKAS